jgi:hypothetical protein
MATNATLRRGHVGIKAILDDMVAVLPPENTTNMAYMRIHTTFGLLPQCIRKAETSDDPSRQYRELQKLEEALRKRLQDLQAKKGIPTKMQKCLDELRDAIREALEQGVDTDFMIQGYEDMVAAPEPTLEEKTLKRPERMVTERRFKDLWEELKEEKRKNADLNRENNDLVLRLKSAQAECDQLLRSGCLRDQDID